RIELVGKLCGREKRRRRTVLSMKVYVGSSFAISESARDHLNVGILERSLLQDLHGIRQRLERDNPGLRESRARELRELTHVRTDVNYGAYLKFAKAEQIVRRHFPHAPDI